jgi:ribosomal protein S21
MADSYVKNTDLDEALKIFKVATKKFHIDGGLAVNMPLYHKYKKMI